MFKGTCQFYEQGVQGYTVRVDTRCCVDPGRVDTAQPRVGRAPADRQRAAGFNLHLLTGVVCM